MAGARIRSVAILSASTVVLSGCDASDTGTVSLEEYVKRECTLLVDFNDRMAHLTRDLNAKSKDQDRAALADTVQRTADLYHELIVKTEELGDPPNGEGKDHSRRVEHAAGSLADTLDEVATDIRDAKNSDEAQAAIDRMNDALVESMTTAAEWEKTHPTPELDRLKEAYPGCSAVSTGV